MQNKPKLIRLTTVPMSLCYPLRGQPSYMHSNGFNVLMVSADGIELPQTLKNEICPHVIVPMTRQITPWKDLKCILVLIRLFKKEKPDIVHTETPKAGLLGMIAAKFAGVKTRVHTVAGMPLMVEKGLKLLILTWVEKLTYACATNIWPNSNSLKTFILKNKLTSAKKIEVIGKGSSNGINTDRFSKANLKADIKNEVKQTIAYDEQNMYLLFIGRLVFDKGIVELVNVFKKLQTQYPNLKLILAGQYEPELDPLPKHIEEEIVSNKNIIHISWTDKVEYYMDLANFFVFPSYREGFPNVLVEAGAMELPIICSRIAGNVDIVTDADTGLIFESTSEKELEEKLLYAFNNVNTMKIMAHKLFEIITSNYKRETYWLSMKKVYERLLN